MGCDGGTIPKRHELVKTAKRGEQKDKDMDRRAKWTCCTISQQALSKPIMMCELGKLYSKESVLEYILDRNLSDSCPHITGMKNVKELKLTVNPGYSKGESGCHDQYFDTQRAEFVCPVVGLEMNGKYKFCTLWGCGCVLSERALKEVDTDTCHNCGSKFQPDDVIIINAEDDDLVAMETNMRTRREMMKAMRKEKKAKKGKGLVEEAGPSNALPTSSVQGASMKSAGAHHEFEPPTKIPTKNSKLDEDHKQSTKDHDSDKSGKKKDSKKRKESSSSSSSKGRDRMGGDGKKRKESSSKAPDKASDGAGSSGSGIDPKKSSVYKKLFTSGAAKPGSDKTAHWVTYNPYHL